MTIGTSNLKVLYSEQEIQRAVTNLAAQLEQMIQSYNSPVVFVCVLKGAFRLFSDLVREIKSDHLITVDFIRISSYDHDVQSEIRLITKPSLESISNKHVFLIDDIIDSGKTSEYLIHLFTNEYNAKTVEMVSLFSRNKKRELSAFVLEGSQFIVGYGMDYNNQFRTLNHIAKVLK